MLGIIYIIGLPVFLVYFVRRAGKITDYNVGMIGLIMCLVLATFWMFTVPVSILHDAKERLK